MSGWTVILLGLGKDKSPVFQRSPIHKEHLKITWQTSFITQLLCINPISPIVVCNSILCTLNHKTHSCMLECHSHSTTSSVGSSVTSETRSRQLRPIAPRSKWHQENLIRNIQEHPKQASRCGPICLFCTELLSMDRCPLGTIYELKAKVGTRINLVSRAFHLGISDLYNSSNSSW